MWNQDIAIHRTNIEPRETLTAEKVLEWSDSPAWETIVYEHAFGSGLEMLIMTFLGYREFWYQGPILC